MQQTSSPCLLNDVGAWFHQVWFDFWHFLDPNLAPAVWFSNVIGGLAYAVLVGIFAMIVWPPFRRWVKAKLDLLLHEHFHRHREKMDEKLQAQNAVVTAHVSDQHAVVHEKLDDVRNTILARLHDLEMKVDLNRVGIGHLYDNGELLRADFEASLTPAQKAKITKARKA